MEITVLYPPLWNTVEKSVSDRFCLSIRNHVRKRWEKSVRRLFSKIPTNFFRILHFRGIPQKDFLKSVPERGSKSISYVIRKLYTKSVRPTFFSDFHFRKIRISAEMHFRGNGMWHKKKVYRRDVRNRFLIPSESYTQNLSDDFFVFSHFREIHISAEISPISAEIASICGNGNFQKSHLTDFDYTILMI